MHNLASFTSRPVISAKNQKGWIEERGGKKKKKQGDKKTGRVKEKWRKESGEGTSSGCSPFRPSGK